VQDDNDEQRAIVAWIIGGAIVLVLAIALGAAIFGMNVASAPAAGAAAPPAAIPLDMTGDSADC